MVRAMLLGILLIFALMGCETSNDAPRKIGLLSDASVAQKPKSGEISVTCGLRPRELGVKLDTVRIGAHRYRLYDQNPKARGKRVLSVVGFKDKCVRQTWASQVQFGSVAGYELLHYVLRSGRPKSNSADKAYKVLRQKYCTSPKNRPCDEGIKPLAQTTVFINFYDEFGSTKRHLQLLIHDGSLLAEARGQ